MKKLIVLLIAVLLPAGAYAADSDSPPLTKKEQRRTLRGYKGFVEVASLTSFEVFGDECSVMIIFLVNLLLPMDIKPIISSISEGVQECIFIPNMERWCRFSLI